MPAPNNTTETASGFEGDTEPEITARPKPLIEESEAAALPEPGLSVTPEELGSTFLRDATEQGNMETFRGDGVASLNVTESAPTDEPLTGPTFEPDHDVWEASVDLTLQSGPLGADVNDLDEPVSEFAEPDVPVRLNEGVIRDGTLLDQEGEIPGTVKQPESVTDDTGTASQLHRRPPHRP